MGSAQTYLKIESKKREKAKYENRKSQIESVRGNISPVADDNVEAINKKIGDVVSELGNALNGIPTETMQSNLNAFKQKYASSDEKLTSATSYLNSEVGDCNNKINELNIAYNIKFFLFGCLTDFIRYNKPNAENKNNTE